VLGEQDLAARKPGSGIPAAERPRVVGRRLARAVPAGTLLAEDDLAPS
jgi:sialic acid synthase SpsE